MLVCMAVVWWTPTSSRQKYKNTEVFKKQSSKLWSEFKAGYKMGSVFAGHWV